MGNGEEGHVFAAKRRRSGGASGGLQSGGRGADSRAASRMRVPVHGSRRGWLRAAGWLAVAVFAVLAGRFWHPYYGFTRFVQLDEHDHRAGVAELREYPVFVYAGYSGYDGAAYTQLAFHPDLSAPEYRTALDNFSYRARRMLGSALAWVLAGGEPARIAGTYAALNLGVWAALALLLWRVLPVTDARSFAAWAGVLFSAGALHAVRLALTDLLAVTLATAALALGERGRGRGALGVLAAAGLARETALTAVVGLWRGPWRGAPAWAVNLGRAAAVAVPLGLWMLYVRTKAGPADQGLANLAWPVLGWIEKGGAIVADFARQPDFRWLNTTTLLAYVALTAQAAYVVKRIRWAEGWWRVGLVNVALMAWLGTAVWEGHPGAATRVLLPLGVAFAVLAVRERAGWAWVLAGGLSVFSGVEALRHVPQMEREFAAGSGAGGAWVARAEAGWYGIERDGRATWAWAGETGRVTLEFSDRPAAAVRVRLKLRGIEAREAEIRQGERGLWRGRLAERPEWIEVEVAPAAAAGGRRVELEVKMLGATVREHAGSEARALGVALYGVEVR